MTKELRDFTNQTCMFVSTKMEHDRNVPFQLEPLGFFEGTKIAGQPGFGPEICMDIYIQLYNAYVCV